MPPRTSKRTTGQVHDRLLASRTGRSMLGGGWVKNFGPPRSHVPAILEPHAELAWNIEAGLVGKAHAGRERRRLAVNEIDRLMNFHADAVAGSMRQAGQPVTGPESPAFIGRRTASSTLPAGTPGLAAAIAIC